MRPTLWCTGQGWELRLPRVLVGPWPSIRNSNEVLRLALPWPWLPSSDLIPPWGRPVLKPWGGIKWASQLTSHPDGRPALLSLFS